MKRPNILPRRLAASGCQLGWVGDRESVLCEYEITGEEGFLRAEASEGDFFSSAS